MTSQKLPVKSELTISVTDFKATCLAVLEKIRTHSLKRVVLTKHGKTIAEILPAPSPKPKGKDDWNPFAHLVGRIVIPEGFDPTAPAYDPAIDGPLPGDDD